MSSSAIKYTFPQVQANRQLHESSNGLMNIQDRSFVGEMFHTRMGIPTMNLNTQQVSARFHVPIDNHTMNELKMLRNLQENRTGHPSVLHVAEPAPAAAPFIRSPLPGNVFYRHPSVTEDYTIQRQHPDISSIGLENSLLDEYRNFLHSQPSGETQLIPQSPSSSCQVNSLLVNDSIFPQSQHIPSNNLESHKFRLDTHAASILPQRDVMKQTQEAFHKVSGTFSDDDQYKERSTDFIEASAHNLRLHASIGLSRFQNQSSLGSNVAAQIKSERDNCQEQTIRYFNNGVEVDEFGIPMNVILQNDATSSLSSRDSLSVNHAESSSHKFASTFRTKLTTNVTISKMMEFIFEAIPGTSALFQGPFSTDKVQIASLSQVMQKLQNLVYDGVLTTKSNDESVLVSNCFRCLESLKFELEENANDQGQLREQKVVQENKSGKKIIEQPWTLFGKEVGGKGREASKNNSDEGNESTSMKSFRESEIPDELKDCLPTANSDSVRKKGKRKKDSPSQNKKKKKTKKTSEGSDSSVLKQKKKSAKKNSINLKGRRQKNIESTLKGPHSDLLNDLFGSSPKHEKEMAINAAHVLLTLRPQK